MKRRLQHLKRRALFFPKAQARRQLHLVLVAWPVNLSRRWTPRCRLVVLVLVLVLAPAAAATA